MIRTILKYVLFGIIIVIVLLWIINGGVGRTQSAASNFSIFNPFGFFTNLSTPSLDLFNADSIVLPGVAGVGDGTNNYNVDSSVEATY